MTFTFKHTAELEFPFEQLIEVELTVTAEYTPASRGSRGAYGEQEEPDEPATIEILSCMDKAKNEYPPESIPGLMEAAWDANERIEEEYQHFKSWLFGPAYN